MRIVIYRKSDGWHVGTISKNGSFERELDLNVFPNFGGTTEDYATLDVPYDYFRLEKVNGVVQAFEVEPPELEPPPPSKEDLMGMELTKMKLENFQKTQIINQLGQDLTKAKIDIIQLKGGM